ncbi:protein of unknown function [Taphrina deformans PYCC 5710]|uniref:Cation/H+ exchanger transmembrane domain-containing protein n=1 Tax=Taphrina deformans (strain PYCC 5710 / ATCC 11124 / CBS 356.35 / IMI 108563 / JCM 9778 / NBRC 8474) TaxID=1097556 RepID=R4XNM3_TAPDE|nr:protein of unknown function [Taphrina deformans PYCC 5710]|eukprot:CCG84845.1 protein of unknown function [Taphrina deformans PYCC 5710]
MSNSTIPGSVLTGENPSVYDKSNPIVVFIIQAVIVIVFCRILHFPLKRLRQPRVIAEVIGGILLGPTAFGRINGFSNAIFPAVSLPAFNLVANIGLILFLFIVGLEVDLRLIRKNAKVALSVGAASLALPFAFGCLIAWALHKDYKATLRDDKFGIFLLFIGTAFSITAFPVLARILTELKLLRQDVGVTVLAAGVGNDVVGWILLALTIALVNSSTGLTAFYVILLVVAWVLLLFFAVKPAYAWLARRSGTQTGPSDTMMTVTILLVLISSFYTQIIGVHPIFGAFLVGLIIPHENNYAVILTEKIEDIVSVLFLPLYFASSGLKTNIALLNSGKDWGYTIAVIICATFSKVVGSMLMARANGFLWRESLTVGTLMSCKGLVELIVLNVGLSAGILSTKLFTMFVVMALVTTFMTTPLTLWFFPPWYQEKVRKWRSGECDWDGNTLEKQSDTDSEHARNEKLNQITIVVNRIEGVSSLLRFTHFFSQSATSVHLMRLMEMTDRLSQIIKVSESDDLLQQDSMVSIFRTVTRVIGVKLTYSLQVLANYEYASVIAQEANKHKTDLVVVPWAQTAEGEWQDNEYISTMLEQENVHVAVLLDHKSEINSARYLRRRTMSIASILTRTRSEADEIHQVREQPSRSTIGAIESEKVHIYLPLFKFGKDERLALLLLSQLLRNDVVSASVMFFKHSDKVEAASTATETEARTGKVQFTVNELSRPTTASSNFLGLGDVQVPDSQVDLAECQTYLQPHPNMKFEVSAVPSPLLAAVEHIQVVERQHHKSTITTILARSTDDFTRRQIRHVEQQDLLSTNFVTSSQGRGQVVEVFAALKHRCGPMIVVQAKQEAHGKST